MHFHELQSKFRSKIALTFRLDFRRSHPGGSLCVDSPSQSESRDPPLRLWCLSWTRRVCWLHETGCSRSHYSSHESSAHRSPKTFLEVQLE